MGIFDKPDKPPPKRKLRIQMYNPGDHFYLRLPGSGIFPGGERIGDKFDTLQEAEAFAARLGYATYEKIEIHSLDGNYKISREGL